MRYARFNSSFRLARALDGLVRLCFAASLGCASAPLHAAPVTSGDDTVRSTVPATRFVSPYTYEWFIRAELALAHGALAEAVEAYRHALAGADEDPFVIARLALALDALGRHDDAQAQLEHGEGLDPESEAIWLARGEIAERHHARDQAIAAYQRAQSFAPHSPLPALALWRVLDAAPERRLDVLQAFRRDNAAWHPHRLHLELTAAVAAGDLTAAQAHLAALRALSDAQQAEVEAVARLAWSQRRTWLARELLGADPLGAHDRSLWLQVLIDSGDMQGAAELLAQTTPDQVGGSCALARAYFALGFTSRGIELTTTCLALDPHDASLGLWLQAIDMPALAAEVRARGVNPADAP